MRLLDRYLLREFLIPLGYCLSVFLIFWIAFDLFNELSNFQQHKLHGADIAHYYLVKMPEILNFPVLPAALLLGLLYCLSNHSRHHELVAIRAAGISIWRLSVPYLVCGVLASILLFLLNDVWLPHSSETAEGILNRYTDQAQSAAERKLIRNLNFRNDRQGRVWNVGVYNLETAAMTNAQVEWVLPGNFRRHIIAETGGWTNHIWFFDNVQLFTYRSLSDATPLRETTNSIEITTFEETPEVIKSEVKINSLSNIRAAKKARLSIAEILHYFRLHPYLTGEKKALLYTQLHARLAGPWTCLVVVLIAIPFGSATGRRNVFVGVASSIVLCFAFFVLSRFGLALGTSGTIPAWLAAWSPNLLFGVTGIWLTNRIR